MSRPGGFATRSSEGAPHGVLSAFSATTPGGPATLREVRVRWGVVLALMVAGCGRFGFDPVPASDASAPGPADAAPTDGAADGAPSGPFGPATLIAELSDSSSNQDDPSLTGDLLEIYFKSDRDGDGDPDIWMAQRSDPTGPWGTPVEVAALSSPSYDGTPEVSLDGLTLYLASDRAGGAGGVDLWRSTRANRAASWSAPVPVAELSSNRNEYAATTDQSATHLVLNRDTPGGDFDLLGAARTSTTGPWGAPAVLVNLSSKVYEADAQLDATGLELYFAGELADADGRDIYRAERSSVDADFGPPERVVELSTASADEDPWVSPDRRTIIFSSDRSGNQQLYQASR